MPLPPETEKDRLEFARRREQLKEDHPELFEDRCPESVHGAHSPLDGRGRCSWCDRKVGPASARPASYGPAGSGDQAQAYREHWDLDWDHRY